MTMCICKNALLMTTVIAVFLVARTTGYNDTFNGCVKWKLLENEFYVDNDETLWSMVHNISYKRGNYAVISKQARVCVPKILLPPANFDLDLLFVILWSISVASLCSIFLISCLVGESVYNLKSLNCHFFFLAASYLFLINRQFKNIPVSWFGILILIAEIVATFYTLFWLNIFGIHLAFNFYYLRKRLTAPLNNHHWRIFIYQNIVVTFLVVISTMAFIFVDPAVLAINTAKLCNAFTESNTSLIMVVYSVLILSNCIWFVVIIINLRKLGRDVESVNKRAQHEMFKLYVFCAVTLAVTWIAQLYPVAVMRSVKGNIFYYLFPSILNSLQGFFLLIAFICKSSVRKCIAKRCRRCADFSQVVVRRKRSTWKQKPKFNHGEN